MLQLLTGQRALLFASSILIGSSVCSGISITKWLFEESNTFIEVTGAIAFCQVQDDVHPGIMKMWGHLRKFAIYFLHYRPGQHTKPQIEAAQKEIFQYAEYAEQHLKGKLLTCLLHRAYAHIASHVHASLPGALLREDFGERLVRWTKGRITGHATIRAAQASTTVCLTEMGMRINKNKNPDIDEPLDRIRPSPVVRPKDGGDDYGTLLHELKNASPGDDRDEVIRCLLMTVVNVPCTWTSVPHEDHY